MGRRYRIGEPPVDVELDRVGDAYRLRIDQREVAVDSYGIDGRYVTVTIDGRTHRYLYAREGGRIHLAHGGRSLCLFAADEDTDSGTDTAGFTANVVAPMPGKVLDVIAKVGDRLEAGAALLLLEAMKMEQTIRTAAAAVVVEVHVETEAMVGPGQTLITLGPLDSE